MKTHIIKENRGRMGVSEMLCGLNGDMDFDDSELFHRPYSNSFFAYDVDSEESQDTTRPWCAYCFRKVDGIK